MNIKYYTPEITAGTWLMRIPEHQRDTGSTTRIFLPEGVHMVKILWEGPVRYFLRFYLGTESSTYRELLPNSVNPAVTPSIIKEVVVPPGGGEIVLWCLVQPTEEQTAPPNQIHAGVTAFLGTNEPTA